MYKLSLLKGPLRWLAVCGSDVVIFHMTSYVKVLRKMYCYYHQRRKVCSRSTGTRYNPKVIYFVSRKMSPTLHIHSSLVTIVVNQHHSGSRLCSRNEIHSGWDTSLL